jgi:hypothetical protein
VNDEEVMLQVRSVKFLAEFSEELCLRVAGSIANVFGSVSMHTYD